MGVVQQIYFQNFRFFTIFGHLNGKILTLGEEGKEIKF